MMSSVDMFFVRGVFRHRAEINHVAGLLEEFDVRPRRTEEQFALLSGGNQQKALLSKWLQRNPKVLLLHEVTQGVDVGARAHIHGIIKGLLEEGTAMLLCSSDFEELAAICDRVMVLSDGRLVRELAGEELTEDAIGHYVQIGAGINVSAGQSVLSDASATT
jgi:ribose transport system ATP-binding protein